MLKNMQEVLEYGFEVLNRVYFDGELPPIVITIMSSPRTNGHYTVNEVWRSEEEYLHEINISAEHLNRPIENIMATLCHEMVHYYCALHGILRAGFVLPAGNQCHDCKNHIDQTPAGPDFHSISFLPILLRM